MTSQHLVDFGSLLSHSTFTLITPSSPPTTQNNLPGCPSPLMRESTMSHDVQNQPQPYTPPLSRGMWAGLYSPNSILQTTGVMTPPPIPKTSNEAKTQQPCGCGTVIVFESPVQSRLVQPSGTNRDRDQFVFFQNLKITEPNRR